MIKSTRGTYLDCEERKMKREWNMLRPRPQASGWKLMFAGPTLMLAIVIFLVILMFGCEAFAKSVACYTISGNHVGRPGARVVGYGTYSVRGFIAIVRVPNGRQILARAKRDVGRNPTGWSRQWCGRMMAMWAGGGPNKASSWAHRGRRVSNGKPGDIFVKSHHVGVIVRCSGGK